jgi:uncharacterized membrane protein YcaP (DUF421 family)
MDHVFIDQLADIARTLLVGTLAYIGLVLLLRASGKRTLSKMNAFDLIVTVALGSTLATILLSQDVALAQGMTALALLIALQFVVTWSSVRFGWVRRVVTGEPALLLHDGRMLPEAMRKARVTADEIRAAIRQAGIPALARVQAVVLETDDTMSVVERAPDDSAATALEGVERATGAMP